MCRPHVFRLARVLTLCGAASQPVSGQVAPESVSYPDAETVHEAGPDDLVLRVGQSGGVDLYWVTHILPRGDGSFVVVNSGTSEIFGFDASGTRIWRAGGAGEGPGEFMDIREAALVLGDSIAVLDALAGRVSLFDADGEFVESFQVERPFEGAGFPTLLVALADGTLLVGHAESGSTAPRPEAVYFRQHVIRTSTRGDRLSPDGVSLPRDEHFVQAVPERFGRVAYWDLAFGRRMTVRAAPGGGILIGDGTEWTVERRIVDGGVLGTHRLSRAIEPVTAADRADYRSWLLEGETGARREMTEKLADEMPYPETKPAYRRFEVDENGRLWLEEYPSPGSEEGSVWIRLDPHAGTTTAVRFPPRYRALAFRNGLAYGVWRDDLDVEYIHVYGVDSIETGRRQREE